MVRWRDIQNPRHRIVQCSVTPVTGPSRFCNERVTAPLGRYGPAVRTRPNEPVPDPLPARREGDIVAFPAVPLLSPCPVDNARRRRLAPGGGRPHAVPMSPADPSSPVRRVASPPTADPRTVSERLEVAARALRAAEHVCVLTGAGISAESGVPTFRDAMTGLWSKYDPQDLATPEAFARDPKLVWRWYAARAATVRAAQPNDAHRALVTLQRFVGHVTLVTQNVDDLHVRAGSQGIIALHGSLLAARCSAGCAGTVEADYSRKSPPRCPTCGALMRPDVVWFGEQLPSAALEAARTATLACDVFLSVGTSNLVEPAASLPWLAAAHGATVIVVNPDMRGQRTGPSIIPLAGPAGLLLPRLVAEAFRGRRPRHRDGGDPADPVALDEVTSKAG